MLHLVAQALAFVLAGAALGWTAQFCFVVAPLAYEKLDDGRARRHVRDVIKTGHTTLAVITLLAGAAALFSGAVGAAVVAAISAAFTVMCQWALAPRTDHHPVMGHRVYKTARVVASALTALLMPIHVTVIVLTGMGI
jgi:hypothetical protein